jgi:16S rRNA (uracil1498-N3)-methyltransferase
MNIFYHPSLHESTILSEDESMHAIKVLRIREGDTVSITDGKGNLYEATIQEANPRKCALSNLQLLQKSEPKPYRLHVAIAPTKNIDRIEWFVEKAIEVGIDEISFLLCDRSERKNINLERIQKIAVSAMKQSLHFQLPILNELISFDKFTSTYTQGFIAHLEEGMRYHLKDKVVETKDLTIIIGPEGDFSNEEISKALAKNYVPVSLGKNRLRTETAGLAACFICSIMNQ